MRLVLFDIDGTLVTGGPAKEAFLGAMVEVFGTAGPVDDHDFSGKTDPQIARELLERVDHPTEAIESGFPRLWHRYLDRLRSSLHHNPMRVLPGVRALLVALEERAEVRLGLVTGNVERGAYLKLESAGLHAPFRVGGFGSDHEVRNHLPAVAVRRAHVEWGVKFEPDAVVIIGDTPRDVECGRAHGAHTVAVATGRWTREALVESGAAVTLDDLSDMAQALDAVLG